MKKRNGFTLIELLVSISIISILMALGIVSFGSAQKKARDTRRQQDMGMLQKAAEQYYSLNSSNYPTTWTSGTSWSVGTQTVLELFPLDPKGVAYSGPATPPTVSAYCMCAYLEGAKGNSTDQNCTFSNALTNNWYCVKNQQ